MARFQRHVFVCINQKVEGKKCCGEEHGLALVKELKRLIRDNGLTEQIRINKSGCLDACSYGPNIVIYPEGIWYGNVQFDDILTIFESHLINNIPVEKLIIDFKSKH